MNDPTTVEIRDVMNRAKFELELLANLAGGVKQGLPILAKMGISDRTFDEPDTRLIYLAMDVGQDRPQVSRLRLAALALHAHGLFDHDDTRTFIGGMRWGWQSLGALFSRIDYDPDRLRDSAARLLAAMESERVRAA